MQTECCQPMTVDCHCAAGLVDCGLGEGAGKVDVIALRGAATPLTASHWLSPFYSTALEGPKV
jgi:hypothetical protein